jgi:hypothetical protein
MPVSPTYPGVYVEEIPSAVQPMRPSPSMGMRILNAPLVACGRTADSDLPFGISFKTVAGRR